MQPVTAGSVEMRVFVLRRLTGTGRLRRKTRQENSKVEAAMGEKGCQ